MHKTALTHKKGEYKIIKMNANAGVRVHCLCFGLLCFAFGVDVHEMEWNGMRRYYGRSLVVGTFGFEMMNTIHRCEIS